MTTLATSAASYAGTAAPTAYTAWVTHGRKCRPCLSAGRAVDSPCQAGRRLWSVYVDARNKLRP